VKTALSDTEIEILKLLTSDLTRDFTILKIAELTGKAKRLTYAAAKKLAKERTIIIQEKANLKLCKLNLRNAQIIAFIESLRWREFSRRHPDIGLLVSTLISKSDLPYLTVAVFGSYAKETATEKSDLDMLVVIPDRIFANAVEAAIESAKVLSNVPLHDVIVTYAEFVDMLKEMRITVAREVLEARYVAYGAEPFYTLIGRLL